MSESDLPVAYASPIGEAASSQFASGGEQQDSWACPQCTLVNSFQSQVCISCNQSRPLTMQEEMRLVDEANQKQQIMAADGISNINDYDSSEDYELSDDDVIVEEVIEGETPFERKLRRKERRRKRMMAGAAVGGMVGVAVGAGLVVGAAAAAAGVHAISKNREKKKDQRVAKQNAMKDAQLDQMS